MPPHHARFSGVSNTHTLALASIRVNPASRAHAFRTRPAFGSPDTPRCAVVHVARRDQTVRPGHPPELPQGVHRSRQVLQGLVRVDDVERGIREVERVGVTDAELDVGPLADRRAGDLDDVGSGIHSDDPPREDPVGEVDGDGAGAGAHVQDAGTGEQRGHQVGRRIGDGSRRVGTQHALMVSVGVRHGRASDDQTPARAPER